MKLLLRLFLLLAGLVSLAGGIIMLYRPEMALEHMNFAPFTMENNYFLGLLGAMKAALGIGFLLALGNPYKQRIIIQVGWLAYLFSVALIIYQYVSKAISFDQAKYGFVIHAIFLIAFTILYPRKPVEEEETEEA